VTGVTQGYTNASYTYSASGAASSSGHTLQYYFDWGDGANSGWISSSSASHAWTSANTYSVKAQARCTTHTSITSAWSNTVTIAVGAAPTPPTISQQPQSQSVSYNTSATLSVTATGTPPLTYQWYRGTSGDTSQPMSGATSSSYMTPSLTTSTSYWVRVSNAYGSVDSNTATITVGGTAPTVVALATSGVTSNGATLNATVNPNGIATTVVFEWGTTTSYGNTTSGQSIGSGTNPVDVTADITGLSQSQIYHYRVVATNSAGTTSGTDVSFTTLSGGATREEFTPFAAVLGALAQVHDLAVGPDGSIYLLVPSNGSLGVFKSTNGGVSFGSPVSIPNSSYSNFEYRLYVDSRNWLHAVWWRADARGTETYYSRSTDGGISFNSPIQVRSGVAYQGYRTDNAIEPVVTADPNGNVFVAFSAYTRDSASSFVGYNIWIAKSTNGGVSFQPEYLINTPSSSQKRPVRIYATSTKLLLIFADETNNDLYTHSGSTTSIISNATRVGPAVAPGVGADLAVDPNDDSKVYLVFADATGDSEGNIRFCKSVDGGNTWDGCLLVNDSTYRYQYQPSIIRDNSGILHVVWTDLRSNSKFQTYYARSTDDGTTFSQNQNVSADQSGDDFTQPHICVDNAIRTLYVSSSKNYSQLVIAKGSEASTTYRISGQVTVSGSGLSGVTMTLSGAQTGSTTTDGSGNYTFSGLAPGGNYTVTPSRTGYTFCPASLSFDNLDLSRTANFSVCNPGAFTLSLTTDCTANGSRNVLAWTPSSAATGYDVFRSGVKIASDLTALTYADTNVSSGTYYAYQILAKNQAGGTGSNVSDLWSANCQKPGAFTLSLTTDCTANGSRNVLAWTPSSNATAYDVFRSGVKIASDLTALTYADTSVSSGTYYAYQILAKNQAGGTGSNVSDLWSANCQKPGAFTLSLTTDCTATGSRNVLTWTVSSNATAYDVFRTGVKIASGLTALTYTDSACSFTAVEIQP
jgi:hypothetical protein